LPSFAVEAFAVATNSKNNLEFRPFAIFSLLGRLMRG
jgi:hypothetical protein